MSYTALARKWRPRKFSEVIGQEHVVTALSNSLKNQRIHHAFLFTGTRGVGKTTLARIFAKALNCENGIHAEPCCQCASCLSIEQGRFVDLIEVDAASRTKVDDTRELLDNVQYRPTQGRYKVYLIDEVHMLSTHSFNALLKTLEEPPEHVKFLLATTDPKKLPATVLSRCIQFNLKSMDVPLLSQQLQVITQHENVTADSKALYIIAKAANGSVRDALSLLDQAIAYSDATLTPAVIREMLGMIEQHYIDDILRALAANEATELMHIASNIAQLSVDYKAALDDLLTVFHHISLYQFSPEALSWKGVNTDKIHQFSSMFSADELQLYYQIGLNGKRDLEYAADARSGFEMVLLRMLAFKPLDSIESLDSSEDVGSHKAPSQQMPPPKLTSTAESIRAIDTKKERENANLPIKNDHQSPINNASKETIRVGDVGDKPSQASVLSESSRFDERKVQHEDSKSSKLRFEPNDLIQNENWIKLVQSGHFLGILKQLVMNMAPLRFVDNTLYLCLDEASSQLFNPGRKQKIQDTVNQLLSSPIKMEIEIGSISEDMLTPAQFKLQQHQELMADTKKSIEDDQYVQELVNLFDAEIDESSIMPAKKP